MDTDTYGRLTAVTDTSLSDAALTEPIAASLSDDAQEGNALWSYHNESRINGIPVAEDCRKLPIAQDDMLTAAFMLDRRPCSLLLYMSPEDTESVAAYDKLLERVYNGEVFIVDETKQFDAAKGRFIVWIRYDELCYVLHPRFKYLKEDL